MRLRTLFMLILSILWAAPANAKLNVVTTMSDFASIVREIGGDLVTVSHLVDGDQDPHFVRPKPSLAQRLAKADLLIATGMDLEMWLPSIIDKSGNARIREGQIGYVAVSDGIQPIEIPRTVDRSMGDVHVKGNPHIHTSPVNMRIVARNITIGLIKVDSENKAIYEKNLKTFETKLYRHLFGSRLIKLIGGKRLCKLAGQGKLISFLEKRKYKGAPMIDLLGGWMKRALPLRNRKVITYHKNWGYFVKIVGLQVVGELEAKPGIPPSPGDVKRTIDLMNRLGVKVVFVANYFDHTKVERVCDAVKATPVIVPLSVGGGPGVDDYFKLIDNWVDRLLQAYGEK